MASYSSYYASSAVPIPSKESAYNYNSSGSTYSSSPPDEERDASVTSGVPSYGDYRYNHGSSANGSGSNYYYGTSTNDSYSYANSINGDYSDVSASGVDFNEYIQDRFADSFDPTPLDRSLVKQAQASGALNAKHRELLDLQAKAQARLAKSRARFTQGLQDAEEVRADLEWTSKKVTSLKTKAEKKHSKEYRKARERYPSPEY